MLRYLAQFSEWFGPLRVFESITVRSILALFFAFAFSLLAGPKFLRWLRGKRATENMDKDSQTLQDLHAVKKGTPTMGGLLLVGCTLLSALLTCNPENELAMLALGVLAGFAAIGLIDDYWKLKGLGKNRGLSKRQKFIAQCLVTLVVYLLLLAFHEPNQTKLLIPFTKWSQVHPDLGVFGYGAFFLLVMVGSSNAVNLTDGLDGLAAGISVMTILTCLVFAYVCGNEVLCNYFLIPHITQAGELTILCAAMIGAVMGFIWFNAHPAMVFMGDTGSLAIGACIAFVMLSVKQELVLPLAGGVFVLEALSVLLQVISFRTTGKRIFKCAPFHHHLEFSGWHENQVVVRLWIMGAITAALGLLTLKMH